MRERAVLLCLIGMISLGGCQATPEKIESWKGTQKGPEKLRGVVADAAADPHLRALAYAALIEIGMAQDAAKDLAAAPPPTRAQITHELVDPLRVLLGPLGLGGSVTPEQVMAKDALFAARSDASGEDLPRIDALLIKWTTSGLAERAQKGGASTEKILVAIGTPAADALVPLMRNSMYRQDQPLAAQIIGEIAAPAPRAQAVAAVKADIYAAGGKPVVKPEQLQLLVALGGPEAAGVLVDLAASGQFEQTRKLAFSALGRGHVAAGDARVLAAGMAVATDSHAPGEIREAAFAAVEKVGPTAVPQLVKLFGNSDSLVRFRAVEAALAAGGAGSVRAVLAGLPEDKAMKNEDLDSFVVHDLQLVGKDAVGPLLVVARQKPAPGHGLAQVAAIRALGHLAQGADRAALDAMAGTVTGSVKTLAPPTELATEVTHARAAHH